MFELSEIKTGEPAVLHFRPTARDGAESRWIKTIPGNGWFVYFRICGQEEPAFDGSRQLPDLEVID